jgi:cytoskeletal protein CcmA (bactofilin family)
LSRQWITTQEFSTENRPMMASDYLLNESIADDLVVMAGNITLESVSHVQGDASLIGGTITIDGAIDGDLISMGDTLTLLPGSHISGDVSLIGSDITLGGQIDGSVHITSDTLTVQPDAQIEGTINPCAATIIDNRGDVPALAPCEHQLFPLFDTLVALRQPVNTLNAGQWAVPGSALLTLVLGSLVLAGFSTLAVAMFPRQISRIEEAIRLRPGGLFGAGFAVFLLVLGMIAALIMVLAVLPPVGLLLLPIYALAGLVGLALLIAGLVTLSLVIGDWILHRVSRVSQPPLITATLGSLVLSTLLALLALAPFGFVLGLVALLVISSVGVGAALFTRLGTRSLQRSYFVHG